MPQSLLLKARGLHTQPNSLGEVPEGALVEAQNVVIDRDGVIEPRRGYKLYGDALPNISDRVKQLLVYKDRLLRHYSNRLQVDSNSLGSFVTFYDDKSGSISANSAANPTVITSTNHGLASGNEINISGSNSTPTIDGNRIVTVISDNTFSIPVNVTIAGTAGTWKKYADISEVESGLRIKGTEANGNFYITTSRGIKKISSLTASAISTSQVIKAGGIKALDLKLSTTTDTAGWFGAQFGTISNISAADPTVITSSNHGLTTGDFITISGSDSTPSVDGDYVITVLSTDTFSIPVNVTIAGTTGDWTLTAYVAYRLVWGYKDANNNLILGSPSSREIIQNNTTDTKVVNLEFPIPQGVTTSYFYQIYRTAITFPSAADQAADPGDEMRLVFEANPTSAEITTGIISATDDTPDDFRNNGANLYTNPISGEGILQSNDPPPLAQDLALFKGSLFLGNTTSLHRKILTLLGTSNLKAYSGVIEGNTAANPTVITSTNHTLVSGDSITIAGSDSTPSIDGTFIVTVIDVDTFSIPVNVTVAGTVGAWIKVSGYSTFTIKDSDDSNTYRFGSEEDSANKIVRLSSADTPAQQIDETSRSLIRVINRQSSEIVYGFYLSSAPNQLPGQFLLEAREIGDEQFKVEVNDAATTGKAFDPNLPDSGSSFTETSDNEVSPNRIFYSKFQQPDAVPSTVNFIDVGAKDEAIKRVFSLRDSLFILKENSVWRLTGDNASNFNVTLFDATTSIRGPDTAAITNNQIYLFSQQGISTVSDTGVSIISRPIEDQLLKLTSPDYTNSSVASFGVGYESDRAYYVWTVTNTSDTVATQCFRFNVFTTTWTNLPISKTCGAIASKDVLHLGASDTNYIEKERKTFSRKDHADREFITTIPVNSVSGSDISLSSVDNIEVGDVLIQRQYLTVYKFNNLLIKLDLDSGLNDSDYVSTLEVEAGADLNTSLLDLSTKLDGDNTDLRTGSITANSAANPTVITSTAHGLTSDRVIYISGSNSTPSINGVYQITVIDANTFSIPVNVTLAGSAGSWTTSYFSIVTNTTNADLLLQEQHRFNNIINALIADPNITGLNYTESSGFIDFEMSVIVVNAGSSSITLLNSLPFISGDVTVYKRIPTKTTWAPQAFGDVSMGKHVRMATAIFERNAFTRSILSYSSDLSPGFDSVTLTGSGVGQWGFFNWGENAWGGGGTAIPFRTLIPLEKQRCRFINPRFEHSTAFERFSLFGISFTFEVMSERAYR